jgi:hypothetical protein
VQQAERKSKLIVSGAFSLLLSFGGEKKVRRKKEIKIFIKVDIDEFKVGSLPDGSDMASPSSPQ